MDFNLSDEEQLLNDMVVDFVDRDYDFEKRRAIKDSPEGYDRGVWQQLGELGLLGILIPAEFGGVDAGPVATMLVMNAFGRALMLEPYLSSAVVATGVIEAAGDENHQRALLPAMAAGDTIAVLAHSEPASRDDLARVATRAEPVAGGYVLNGQKARITHAPLADQLIVSARVEGADGDRDGISLFRVSRSTPGVETEPYANLDGQRAGDVRLKDVELSSEARVGPEGAAYAALEHADALGIAAVCAEAVGAMQALLDATAEYLRTRRQFGRPIGRFQALQHRAADMLIHCEQAKSMSYLAAMRCLDPDVRERRRALSAAKVVIGRACRFVGQQAVQLHGGMGVTDELSVSHYFKRLTAIEFQFGGVDTHIDRFVATW